MKRLVKYIFFIFCLLTSCQKPELVEIPAFTPGEGVYGEATITFSVSIPRTEAETKAMGSALSADLKNLYLIIFDENGYLVESRAARYTTVNDDVESSNIFEVTLSLTDKRRIIHFIANCPEAQIRPGHENEVISSMYVTKGQAIETAYWHRTVVENIFTDGEGNLVGDAANKFKGIPMLRNYARISVVDNDADDDFELLKFGVYNSIDIGTVAPYNKSTQTFQSFIGNNGRYSYDDLVALGFDGHALINARLNSTLTEDDLIDDGGSYYMYERRVDNTISNSNEVPPHIILKGLHGDGTVSYYKVDLIEHVDNITKFYHILRNFEYVFKLKSVNGAGYSSIAQAMAKPASNNLAGSLLTQDMTNISDGTGRIYVSFTSVTLVSNDDVTLRFKYIPDIETGEIDNAQVSFSGLLDGTGSVLKSQKSIKYDAGDGWGEVTFKVQDPGNGDKTQQIVLLAGSNRNLQKTITFRLVKPYTMAVVCYNPVNSTSNTPNRIIAEGISNNLGVEIRIPDNVTDDMFPLEICIEADKLSISPNVSIDKTGWTDNIPDDFTNPSLPVESGVSIIPRKNKQSFYYVYRIETLQDFQKLGIIGSGLDVQRVIRTYWLTNVTESASYVVAYNKYFKVAGDYFVNEPGQELENPLLLKFDAELGKVKYGAGQTVDFEFNMSTLEPVTITLTGLEPAVGSSLEHVEGNIYTYNPTQAGVQTLQFRTTGDEGEVSVVLEAASYGTSTSSVTQTRPYFIIDGTGFSKASLGQSANEEVTFTFTLSDYEDGMFVDVALEGLVPADNKLAKVTRDAVTYRYEPKAAECVLNLKTETSGAKTCSVQLSADEYYYNQSEKKTIEQIKEVTYSGTVEVKNVTLKFESDLQTDRNYTSEGEVVISVENATEIKCGALTYRTSTSYTNSRPTRYYITGITEFNINGITITGENIDDNTIVTITITVTTNNGSRDVTYRKTIKELDLVKQ